MTATTDAPATTEAPVEKKPIFGRQEKRALMDPLWDDNPIALHVLGICSALAVTTQMAPTLVMCGAVIFVLAMSNTIISMLRNHIPHAIRIIVMLTVISTLVTLVSLFLQRFAYDISKQIAVFVALIVTNCIVMGRADAYAMANKPWPSFLDGVGNALGYSWILIAVAFFRELGGSGKLFGAEVIPASWYAGGVFESGYINNGLFVLAPGAFIILGLIVWVQRAFTGHTEDN